MIRTSNLTKKPIRDLALGELIRFSVGGSSALAILLENLDEDNARYGIISSKEFSNPLIWYVSGKGGDCLSYGSDWVLHEEHGSETGVGLMHTFEDASLLLNDELYLTFDPPRGTYDYGHVFYGLSSCSCSTNLSREAAPIYEWSIWESDERWQAGSEALFTFTRPANTTS